MTVSWRFRGGGDFRLGGTSQKLGQFCVQPKILRSVTKLKFKLQYYHSIHQTRCLVSSEWIHVTSVCFFTLIFSDDVT